MKIDFIEYRYQLPRKDIVHSVNISNGPAGNISNDQSLKEANEILEELRNRSFNVVKDDAAREKISARNASVIANNLEEQANAINDRVSKFNSSLGDLLEALKNIRKESGTAKGKSGNATSLVAMAKAIDWKVCWIRSVYNYHKNKNYNHHLSE